MFPVAVLAMDTIGHLPVTSGGQEWAFSAICMHTSYVFAVPMKEMSAENAAASTTYQEYSLTQEAV